MTLSIGAKTYALDTYINSNRVTYSGPAKTFNVKDDLTLGRTIPRAQGMFGGTAKSEIKLTRTLTLADGVTKKDALVTIVASTPVGAVAADVETLWDDVSTLAASASGSEIVQKQKLNF